MIPVIIEIKTGPVKPWTAFQTVAQKILLIENLKPGVKSRPISDWEFNIRDDCFVKESHQYFNKDMSPIPGITKILRAVGLVNGIEYCSEDALWRGQEVHRMVHELNNPKARKQPNFDGSLVGYMDAWIKFVSVTGFKYMLGEVPMVSERYQFGGTLDNFGYFPSDKISSFTQRFGLELRRDGAYNLIQFKEYSDENVFLSALTVYSQQARKESTQQQTTGGIYAE